MCYRFPQFVFQDAGPLPRLKFLIWKFPLTDCQEFIVVLDGLRALVQAVVRERAEEQVAGVLGAQRADAIEGGERLRILLCDHQRAGELVPGVTDSGLMRVAALNCAAASGNLR